MTLWVNGSVVADDAAVLRADDHGVVVGDGVFETAAVTDGVPFALTRHLRRLERSASGLGLPVDLDRVRAGVVAVLDGHTGRGRLRITVTGGPSPYGSDRGGGPASVLVAVTPLSQWPLTTDLAVVPWTRNERAATAGLKTTSYADNVVALQRAHQHGASEAIFTNTRGDVCEGTGSNIFYEHDGLLVTPPLATGCLAGVTRELLLEWLQDEGRPVHEQALPIDTLRDAREVFITSSTRDVMPAASLDGAAVPEAPGPLTEHAAEVFARRAAESPDP